LLFPCPRDIQMLAHHPHTFLFCGGRLPRADVTAGDSAKYQA
jgi:hypothetical protein